MDKSYEREIYVNPDMCRPSAIRSMLPVLLSKPSRNVATTGAIYLFRREPEVKQPR